MGNAALPRAGSNSPLTRARLKNFEQPLSDVMYGVLRHPSN